MSLQIDLTGQHILVTGASRGIGRAIAIALSQAGAVVGIHYASNDNAAKETASLCANKTHIIQADLSDPVQTSSLFEQAILKFGKMDALISNAGIAINSPLTESSEKWLMDWEQTMQVNLRAAGQLSREAINHFKSNGRGRIVFISSRAAFRGDTAEYLAYAASKGGIVALSKSIARQFGRDGIKSFDIAPGFIDTDMAQDFITEYGEAYILSDLALDSLTKPKDISPMVVLLCSGLADHATGTTIDINAGSYVH